jgi:hypothetical protein
MVEEMHRDVKVAANKKALEEKLGDIPNRKDAERIRVTLDLTPSMKAVLDHLSEQMDGATSAEVLRRAIALLNIVKDPQAKGQDVALVNPQDDRLVAKLVGF